MLQRAYTNLRETKCLACDGTKKARQSFCRACYFRLPAGTRKALYEAEGYAETFERALTILRPTPARA